MIDEELPLFPLHAVLFPGGILPLRIFEPRYVDMVGRCTREATEFGVALIREGVEAGGPAHTHEIGTLCRIVDFDRMADGLLGITGLGTQRFAIAARRIQADGLNLARVERLQESVVALPAKYEEYATLLRHVLPQSPTKGLAEPYSEDRFADAGWIAARITDVLPMPLGAKQRLLEMHDPLARLRALEEFIELRPT